MACRADATAGRSAGEKNVVRAGHRVLEMGPQFVVIKKGEHGAMFFSKHETYVLPAYPTADVVDPTGAGDSFAGGMDLNVLARIKTESGENPAPALFDFIMNGHRILRKIERAGMDPKTNKGGKPVATQRIAPVKEMKLDFDMPLAGLAPGAYALEARHLDRAELVKAQRQEIVIVLQQAQQQQELRHSLRNRRCGHRLCSLCHDGMRRAAAAAAEEEAPVASPSLECPLCRGAMDRLRDETANRDLPVVLPELTPERASVAPSSARAAATRSGASSATGWNRPSSQSSGGQSPGTSADGTCAR